MEDPRGEKADDASPGESGCHRVSPVAQDGDPSTRCRVQNGASALNGPHRLQMVTRRTRLRLRGFRPTRFQPGGRQSFPRREGWPKLFQPHAEQPSCQAFFAEVPGVGHAVTGSVILGVERARLSRLLLEFRSLVALDVDRSLVAFRVPSQGDDALRIAATRWELPSTAGFAVEEHPFKKSQSRVGGFERLARMSPRRWSRRPRSNVFCLAAMDRRCCESAYFAAQVAKVGGRALENARP